MHTLNSFKDFFFISNSVLKSNVGTMKPVNDVIVAKEEVLAGAAGQHVERDFGFLSVLH